jgi:hypothetical protein
MPIKTQGTIISIETALATSKPITGATAAKPCVLTALAHGYLSGDVIKILNVQGMLQLNNRAFLVDDTAGSPITNKFGLKGVDASNYLPYISGGDSYKATMTPIGGVSGAPNLFQGTAPTITTTTLNSVAQEYIMGLQTFGNAQLDMIYDDGDLGQQTMLAAKESGLPKCFSVKLTTGKVATFLGFVTSFDIQVAQNDVVKGTSQILIAGAPGMFA